MHRATALSRLQPVAPGKTAAGRAFFSGQNQRSHALVRLFFCNDPVKDRVKDLVKDPVKDNKPLIALLSAKDDANSSGVALRPGLTAGRSPGLRAYGADGFHRQRYNTKPHNTMAAC